MAFGVVKTLSRFSLDYGGISHTLYLSRLGLREHYSEHYRFVIRHSTEHYKRVIHSVILNIEEISDAKRITSH